MEEAYALNGNDDFLIQLRTMWLCRALLYIDGNSYPVYINYTYSMDHPMPHVLGDPSWFRNRRLVPLDERNPNVPQAYADSLLYLYPENPSADQNLPDLIGIHFQNDFHSIIYTYEYHKACFFRFLVA